MFTTYFKQELSNLRDLGAEFAKRHPAVAPMLGGMTTDPDTERLLEGVAFLTALLRQRLDDDFPEIIQGLFQLIWPHYLRPLPAATVVAFWPRESFKQAVRVPKGVHLASEPVDGTPCLFRTCYDVDVHPLMLERASLEQKPGRPPDIRLMLRLQDTALHEWHPESLRLYLAGDVNQAADLYLLLCRYLHRIILKPLDGGEPCALPADCLKPVGFGADEQLIPYPSQSFPGYRVIQEYFLLPEKFFFLDLGGFNQWRDRGNGQRFEIRFELTPPPFAPPRVSRENFALAATPAINLFAHDADPIRLDHRKSDYLVRPSAQNGRNFQVYSVEHVTGFIQGTARERTYAPFEMFSLNPEEPTYHVNIRQSPIRPGFDVYLSVAYPEHVRSPAPETLSLKLQCTNAQLPEGLRAGDIRHPTSDTPEFIQFKNLTSPTSAIMPPVGRNLQWKLISHLCLNYRSLANAENLKALLALYNFEENRDRRAFLAYQKRIDGIQEIHNEAADQLVGRVIMRGRRVRLEVRQDHYAGPGDLFLFGSVLADFIGLYASMNTFTRFSIRDMLKGEELQWPARIGDHPLI